MTGAVCYGLYEGNTIIGFMAIRHFPHPKNPKIKMVHRLVILPDYQGIGLGVKFLNSVAKMYADKGYDFSIITSAKNLTMALRKNNKWIMVRYSSSSSSHRGIVGLNATLRKNVKTASFYYKR